MAERAVCTVKSFLERLLTAFGSAQGVHYDSFTIGKNAMTLSMTSLDYTR